MAKVSKEEAQAERRALTTKLKQIVFAVYDCKCAVCGYTNNPEFMVDREKMIFHMLQSNGNAIHHVKPVHLGGKTTLENLILLCPTHHKEAHDGIVNCEDYVIQDHTAMLKLCRIFNEHNKDKEFYNPNLSIIAKLLTNEYKTIKAWFSENKRLFNYGSYLITRPAEEPIIRPAEKSITRPAPKPPKLRHPKGKLTWQGSWIKLSEALPQKGEWVLIYYNNAVEQGVKLAKWTGENFLRNPYFNYDFNKIDYWMSLSEIGKFKSFLPVENEEVLIWYKYPFESEANVKLLKWAKDNRYSDFITGWIPLPDPLLGIPLRSGA